MRSAKGARRSIRIRVDAASWNSTIRSAYAILRAEPAQVERGRERPRGQVLEDLVGLVGAAVDDVQECERGDPPGIVGVLVDELFEDRYPGRNFTSMAGGPHGRAGVEGRRVGLSAGGTELERAGCELVGPVEIAGGLGAVGGEEARRPADDRLVELVGDRVGPLEAPVPLVEVAGVSMMVAR